MHPGTFAPDHEVVVADREGAHRAPGARGHVHGEAVVMRLVKAQVRVGATDGLSLVLGRGSRRVGDASHAALQLHVNVVPVPVVTFIGTMRWGTMTSQPGWEHLSDQLVSEQGDETIMNMLVREL